VLFSNKSAFAAVAGSHFKIANTNSLMHIDTRSDCRLEESSISRDFKYWRTIGMITTPYIDTNLNSSADKKVDIMNEIYHFNEILPLKSISL